MKTAVIYARYSSDSQSEQSIEGQLRECNQYAKNNNILIVGTYIDRAMTGTNDLRPDFQRMIKDSAKKQWDYVLVYKLDRFSRDKYETTIHKHTLKTNGVKVISAMENIPDTPEGLILESLLEGMNQYYSAELSQKVLRGLRESYIKGRFTGGFPLYGYDVIDKKNVINQSESEIVKEIFTRYSNGETGKSIANNMIERGIRNKKGHYMDEKNIYKIIGNVRYSGKVKHGEQVYTNIYPQIVDDITWKKVQDIRNHNKQTPGGKKEKYEFILSGKLICGDCGCYLLGESGTSRNGKRHKYYTCFSRRRKKHNCKLSAVSKEWLEDAVFTKTYELFSNEENLNYIVNSIYKLHQENNKEDALIKSLEKKKNDAIKASNNLISALEQGFLTEQTKTRLKELESEIAQLDFDIDQAKQRNYSYLTPELIKDYLQKAIIGNIDDIETRKMLIRFFIREIIVYNDKIIITYNFQDNNQKKKTKPDDIKEINKAIKQADEPVFYLSICSYKETSSAPSQNLVEPN